MATRKRNITQTREEDIVLSNEVIEENNVVMTQEKKESEQQKVQKKYKSDDLITCRSVTGGKLLMRGKKTGILYVWSGDGDSREVEYQDLLSLKVSRSRFLYDPLFVIEDEDLLEQWSDVKEISDKIKYTSINEMLNYPPSKFESALKNAPIGIKNSIKTIMASKILSGEFDSISKIKSADKILKTELINLIG